MIVFVIITVYVIYSVGFRSKQVWLAKPGFTHVWQIYAWEVGGDTYFASQSSFVWLKAS